MNPRADIEKIRHELDRRQCEAMDEYRAAYRNEDREMEHWWDGQLLVIRELSAWIDEQFLHNTDSTHEY